MRSRSCMVPHSWRCSRCFLIHRRLRMGHRVVQTCSSAAGLQTRQSVLSSAQKRNLQASVQHLQRIGAKFQLTSGYVIPDQGFGQPSIFRSGPRWSACERFVWSRIGVIGSVARTSRCLESISSAYSLLGINTSLDSIGSANCYI
jgi:hypothetical protein